MKKDKKETNRDSRKVGTFGGVFTPSVLTILGVILFLRYDTVVGNAGLWGALLVLLIERGLQQSQPFRYHPLPPI
ncbi:MAG: hypothetical protein K9G58_12820 [Bacteroidales bacterium]|nr:hypothetical protein [Bacteroidales bacterium]